MAERGLHIAVDGRELCGKPTGVGRYLSEILRSWADDPGFAHRCTIVVPREPPADLLPAGGRFTRDVAAATAAGTVWEQTRLARRVRALAPDVLFAPGYTAPLWIETPVVLTVHDVSFFAHPEWFSPREGRRRRWLTRASARRARTVLTVSRFSADEITRWTGVARDRILVAGNGAPRVATPPPSSPLDAREPMVLFAGSLFTRRRIPDLLQGFAQVASPAGARLVLVGDNRTAPRIDPVAIAASLGLGDRVEWRAWVDDTELHGLYGRARAFAFLSDYEGFAIPPLEAIAYGVPPVLLDTPVAREVYADAALYVRPDPHAIAGALTTLLTDADVRRRLAAAGREALARHSWTRTARAVREALEAAAR